MFQQQHPIIYKGGKQRLFLTSCLLKRSSLNSVQENYNMTLELGPWDELRARMVLNSIV